jgi:hypothetical protein
MPSAVSLAKRNAKRTGGADEIAFERHGFEAADDTGYRDAGEEQLASGLEGGESDLRIVEIAGCGAERGVRAADCGGFP